MCLVPLYIQAQINLRPGYIITNNNDTIFGSIDFRTAERNVHQCTFKELASGEIQTYTPGEIYAYRFTDDGKFYVTRTITVNEIERKYFLEYVIQGIISLYYLPSDIPRYFFETEQGIMVEVSKEDKQVRTEAGSTVIKEDTRYIGALTYIFSEDENVQKKIPRTGIGRGILTKLTREYHYAVCTTGEDCIEFEAKPDKRYIRINFTVQAGIKANKFHFAGYLKDNLGLDKMNSATPSLGVELGFKIPRLSRAVSLQLGADVSYFKGERVISSNTSGYNMFQSEAFLLENHIGIRLTPFTGKVQPYFEAGYCHFILSGIELKNQSEEYKFGGVITETETDYSDDPPTLYPGWYGALGIYFPVNKHAISLSLSYQSTNRYEYKLNTIGANLKFTF